MTRWKVTRVERGPGSSITGLYGVGFGYRTTVQVAQDIEDGAHSYYVRAGSHESEIRVIEVGGQKHLVSTTDVLSYNNLFNLPQI